MTLKVKTSQLGVTPEAFAVRVAAHFERLVEYYKHLDGVREDAANDALKPDERRVAFPGPVEDELVELAIYRDRNDDGSITPVIDYEFEGPSLAEKKGTLVAQVNRLESNAVSALMPTAKQRHWQFREQDIRMAGHEAREPEDTAFIAEMVIRRNRVGAVQRWAAKLEHDIEDLTDETVDAFVVTPFNG